MPKRELGRSGIEVSVLGIGAWSFGGGDYWGPQDQGDADAVVRAALDAGANYFDTAEGYNDGRSEESLGQALGSRRDEAVIGSKVSPSNCRPEALRAHCEASLRRLGTDRIDVYMVHWPLPSERVPDACTTLMALRAEGKIRAIGLSNFGVGQITETLGTGARIDADQLCYNILSRAIEFEILPLCRKEQIGVMAYMPLLQGILTGKYRTLDEVPPARLRTRHFRGDRPGSRHGQSGAEDLVQQALTEIHAVADGLGVPMGEVALAWCMAKPGISTTVTGIRNAAQLAEGVRAATTTLPADALARLDAATEALRLNLGPNADYFQSDANSRTR